MEFPHYEDESDWEANDMYAANEKNHFYAIDNAYRTALFYLNGITLAELSQIVIFELSTNVAEIDNNIDFLLRTMNNFAALQQANFRDLNSNELISLS